MVINKRLIALSIGISLLQLPLVALADGPTGPTGSLPTQPAQIAAEPPIERPILATEAQTTGVTVSGGGNVGNIGPSGGVGANGGGGIELRHTRTRMVDGVVRDDDIAIGGTISGGSQGLTVGADGRARVTVGVRTAPDGASFCFNGVGESQLSAGYRRPFVGTLQLGVMPGLCYSNQAGTMVLAGPTVYGVAGQTPDGSNIAAGAGGRVVVIQDEHRFTAEGGSTFVGNGGTSGGLALRYDRLATEGSPFIYGAQIKWDNVSPSGGNSTNVVTGTGYVGVAF